MRKTLILLMLAAFCAVSEAATKETSTYYSLQALAFTANAGGQSAFALRRRAKEVEWSLFANQYLQAGSMPLIGVTWDRRFDLAGPAWPFKPYLQTGIGVCSGGPLIELMWGFTVAYLIRIDIVTHLIATQARLVSWNYPFWTGITVPI